MSFKNYLKSKLRYVLGIATCAALLSQLLSPILSAQADGPRFNFLTGDYQILEGLNVSKSETVWKNPVSGNAGDEFRGSVYYHNGMVNTTAENTRIKVNIPHATSGKSAKITASISADNAATVTSTIVDGQLVGLDGLVVNLDRDAEIEFVPGSVEWFPNSSTNNPNVTPTPLPGGQSGNEIVSGGVNIGNIQGCWQFAGFVTFKFRTKVKEAPAIAIEKTVRNVTKDGSSFSKETFANRGDIVQFQVEVENKGNVDIDDAVVKDQLPAGLEFVSGSLEKENGQHLNLPDTDAAKFFDGGLSLEKIAAEGAQKVTLKFKAKVTDGCKDQEILVNKAIVTAKGLTAQSSATVKVVEKPVPNIVMKKSAFNKSKNKPVGEATNNISDTIAYTLTTENTGNAAVDVEIKDDIADVLRNADIVTIGQNGRLEGNEIKWPSVCIQPGEKVERTFEVRIKHVSDKVCFVNKYGNEVKVCVDVPKVVNPCLHIEKLVRDVTTNEGNFVKSNEAHAGDTLEYLINFSNTGNGPADKVKISDVLPANTQYVAGSTRISRGGGDEHTLPDGITGAGITLDTVPAGESDFIKFRVITSSTIAVNEILVNTASINNISDTASTKIVAKLVAAAVTPSLPKTGATSAASFMVTLILGVAFLYYKYKKLVTSEEVLIINSMLG